MGIAVCIPGRVRLRGAEPLAWFLAAGMALAEGRIWQHQLGLDLGSLVYSEALAEAQRCRMWTPAGLTASGHEPPSPMIYLVA